MRWHTRRASTEYRVHFTRMALFTRLCQRLSNFDERDSQNIHLGGGCASKFTALAISKLHGAHERFAEHEMRNGGCDAVVPTRQP